VCCNTLKNGDLDPGEFERAAEALKLTAQDLLNFRIIDDIIPEPPGGIHRDPKAAAEKIKETILNTIEKLRSKNIEKLLEERYKKLRRIGKFSRQEF